MYFIIIWSFWSSWIFSLCYFILFLFLLFNSWNFQILYLTTNNYLPIEHFTCICCLYTELHYHVSITICWLVTLVLKSLVKLCYLFQTIELVNKTIESTGQPLVCPQQYPTAVFSISKVSLASTLNSPRDKPLPPPWSVRHFPNLKILNPWRLS